MKRVLCEDLVVYCQAMVGNDQRVVLMIGPFCVPADALELQDGQA